MPDESRGKEQEAVSCVVLTTYPWCCYDFERTYCIYLVKEIMISYSHNHNQMGINIMCLLLKLASWSLTVAGYNYVVLRQYGPNDAGI